MCRLMYRHLLQGAIHQPMGIGSPMPIGLPKGADIDDDDRLDDIETCQSEIVLRHPLKLPVAADRKGMVRLQMPMKVEASFFQTLIEG